MKISLIKLLFSFLLIIFSFSKIFAQTTSRFNKNTVHVAISPDLVYFGAYFYYERMISEKPKVAQFLRVGFGEYVTLSSNGNQYLSQYGILTGDSNHHFEGALGATYLDVASGNKKILPSFSTGYRYQKPQGHFVFRTGIGFPELIFVGVGYSF